MQWRSKRSRRPRPRQPEAPIVADYVRSDVTIYTDGSCDPNPGPAGIGIVLITDNAQRHERSEYIGHASSNVAELMAIVRGLERTLTLGYGSHSIVDVHSDSEYAIGMVSKGWRAKVNVEIVELARALVARFRVVRFVKVRGHAGVILNELADDLAGFASREQYSSSWHVSNQALRIAL